MENNVEKKALAKEALQALNDLENEVKMEEIIKDNAIEFKVDDILYRVRRPSGPEREQLLEEKRRKYSALVKDDSYMFRKQWIAQLKNKGVDIQAMENKLTALRVEVRDLLLKLAKTSSLPEINQLKQMILDNRDEQYTVSMEITDYLSYSIEDKLLVYINGYTTYVVFEKQVGDKWEKVYKTYEEFINSESKALAKAFYYINYLIYSAV
jgi:DNA repair exonuclease SbcCD ATPase subunit